MDQPLDIDISRLIVKCPERECDVRVEVRNLDDHIRVCNWRPTNCPFFKVGCRNFQDANDTMEQHLLSENQEHMKLLMDYFDIGTNEMGEVKEAIRETRLNLREETEVRLAERGKKRKQISFIGGLILLIVIIIAIGIFFIARESRQIDQLGGQMAAVVDDNRQMKDNINEFGIKIKGYEKTNWELRYNMEQMTEILGQMKSIENNISEKISDLEKRMKAIADHQNQLNYGEFVWKIGNFSHKRQNAQNGRDTQIFSPPFFSYKNGYKMCLSVFPDGDGVGKGTHLSVYFHLMHGAFDDVLPWPFKHDVTLAIVNQQSGLNYVTKTIKYDKTPNSDSWNKTSRINIGIGFPQFIRLDELLANSALSANDRIIIKCKVHKSPHYKPLGPSKTIKSCASLLVVTNNIFLTIAFVVLTLRFFPLLYDFAN